MGASFCPAKRTIAFRKVACGLPQHTHNPTVAQSHTLAPYRGSSLAVGPPCRVIWAEPGKGSSTCPICRLPPLTRM